ncbi:MAG: DUF393 domain-containing protein [Phycisphaera sp. TMED24]|nr:MAG: DUF393 domain-containing protein [Phycisphaera sp. TMED24]
MDLLGGPLPAAFRSAPTWFRIDPLPAPHQSHLPARGNPYGSGTYGCRVVVLGRRINGKHGLPGPGLADLGCDRAVRCPGSPASRGRASNAQGYCQASSRPSFQDRLLDASMRARSNWEFGVTQETNDNVSDGQHRFTLLYDGECPLCRREIEWFSRRDPEAMHVVDISVNGFDSNAYGLAQDDVHRELHGIKPDGTVTVGMDSVREAYRVIGLGFMVSFTAFWPFRPITDWMYRRFAANRLKIGTWLGRANCDENSCRPPSNPPKA